VSAGAPAHTAWAVWVALGNVVIVRSNENILRPSSASAIAPTPGTADLSTIIPHLPPPRCINRPTTRFIQPRMALLLPKRTPLSFVPRIAILRPVSARVPEFFHQIRRNLAYDLRRRLSA